MEIRPDSIIIDEGLDKVFDKKFAGYVAHAYCFEAGCGVMFNGKKFDFQKGDCMIIVANGLVERVEPREGFKVMVILGSPEFLQLSTPPSNYGTRGGLSLFVNPIMRLNEDEQWLCSRGFLVFFRHPVAFHAVCEDFFGRQSGEIEGVKGVEILNI